MKFKTKTPELKHLFLQRMQQLLPDKKDFQNYLKILKIPPVRSIRCNKLKITPEKLKKRLENKGWKISQPWKGYPEVMIVEGKLGSLQSRSQNKKTINKNLKVRDKITPEDFLSVNKFSAKKSAERDFGIQSIPERTEGNLQELEPGELGRAIEHQLGYYYIQELASMLPVIALAPEENELILDLCAAPGSKTTQLSSEMNATGSVIANEVSMGRLKILASNLERCSATNTIITRKDGFALCKRLAKYNPEIKFDKILVDAPCSGEGTLRSSLKTYKMWNIKTIQNLPKIQHSLIESALEILKPNGILIYSTCTHAPEENEGVVDYILEKFGDKVKLEKITLPVKTREGLGEWDIGGGQIREKVRTKRESNKSLREFNKLASDSERNRGSNWAGGQTSGDKPKKLKFSKEVKKCARVYPQDNNTEGFFIAKFRRLND